MKKLRVFGFILVLLAAGFFAGKFFVPEDAQRAGIPVSGTNNAAIADSVSYQSGLIRVARVIDGDTIELAGGERVRYIGIDTPEIVDPRKPVQCFGVEAARRNRELVEEKSVRLEKDISERDKYGRLLRYVWAGNVFVNWELINEGYATASTFPPDVKYATMFAAAEKEARAANRGLWDACPSFGSPATSTVVTSSDAAIPENSSCVIKGNISSGGERIYHLPGCPYYDKTKIDEARGERWFCSEAEAVAAGWRKTGNCQ